MNTIIDKIIGNETIGLNLRGTLRYLSDLERHSILEGICNALKTNSTIKMVDLSHNKIDDIDTKHIADVLEINSIIKTIDLRDNNIGDIGVKYISDALKINLNLNLNKLYLSSNYLIGDIGVKHISDALKINSTLNKLYLGGNQISDIGAKYISDVLKINITLNVLNLWDNQMSDIGVKYIIDALEINSAIIYMFLDKNQHYQIINKICKRNKHNGCQKNIILRSLCYGIN